ncbi:MAG: tripartite tricarboxylate transporter substrate binding protein BugD, partial [Bradyrhizobium sp.]
MPADLAGIFIGQTFPGGIEMTSIRSLAGACLSAFAALGAFAVPASAQTYPTRTITIIVPFMPA